MKKITLIAVCCLMAFTAVAQTKNVQTAFNYLKKSKYDKALEYITPALEHSQTSDMAKTWFYYGRICLGIAMSKDEADNALMPDALEKAQEAFKKTIELDKREQYSNEVLLNMASISDLYYQHGVDAYNKNTEEGFEQASNNFMKVFEVKSSLGMVDTAALSNAALCMSRINKHPEAITILEQVKALGYSQPDLYSSLTTSYIATNQMEKAEELLKEGLLKFPNNHALLIASINLYLKQNKQTEAVAVIDKALELDPKNHTLYFAKGDCYSNQGNIEEAKAAYLKALEIKPDYLDAMYNLGALYINAAAPLIDEANKLPLDAEEQYNKLLEDADKLIEQALPYMENAHQLDPKDQVIKNSLKEIYVRLKKLDKLEALKKEGE